MSRRFLMRATRLVTLALLFCHVGQYTISIFILFSDLSNVANAPANPSGAPASERLSGAAIASARDDTLVAVGAARRLIERRPAREVGVRGGDEAGGGLGLFSTAAQTVEHRAYLWNGGYTSRWPDREERTPGG